MIKERKEMMEKTIALIETMRTHLERLSDYDKKKFHSDLESRDLNIDKILQGLIKSINATGE